MQDCTVDCTSRTASEPCHTCHRLNSDFYILVPFLYVADHIGIHIARNDYLNINSKYYQKDIESWRTMKLNFTIFT